MATNLPGQFFTAVNIGSVTLATSAIIVVTNTLYTLFSLSRKWSAFAMAIIISYLNVIFNQGAQWYDWVLAFVNACLLFCSALGLNELTAGSSVSGMRVEEKKKKFISSWL
jgi:hypothetical protein